MKIKTSITLTQELLSTINELSGQFQNRSYFLETAAWNYIDQIKLAEQEQRDLDILNHRATALNGEVTDALGYQKTI